MPRTSREKASIQATVYSKSREPASISKNSSSVRKGTVCSTTKGPETGTSWISAAVMRPVSPSPAALAVRAEQFQPAHVAAKTSRPGVVLAVDVVGDCAADGDDLRPRDDRNEVPARQGEGDQIRERHPRLAADHTRLLVEGDEAVEPSGGEDHPAVVEADVPVAAALAYREHRLRCCGQGVAAPGERNYRLRRLGIAAPGLEHRHMIAVKMIACSASPR